MVFPAGFPISRVLGLLRQREAQADTIIGIGRRIRGGRDDRLVDLQVVEGADRQGAAQAIFRRELDGLGDVAARRLRETVLDLADQGVHLAVREIEVDRQVVAEILAFLHPQDLVELGELIAETDHELVGKRLDDLVRGDIEAQIARLAILDVAGQVVEHRRVDPEERVEALGEADGRDVVGRRGGRIAGQHVADIAQAVLVGVHPIEERREGAHAVRAAVLVAQGNALQVFLEEGDLDQAVVGDPPVGQHRLERREAARKAGTSTSIELRLTPPPP